jgi:3',5'-cyclic AMP phosphodiesterase CpdA
MPGIFYQPVERRNFLKIVSAAGAAAVLSSCRSTPERAQPATAPGKDFHLALLSDTHIPADRMNGNRGFNPWENLKKVVPEVEASRPEGVILCGDAARLDGQIGDYNELRTLLEPVASFAPIYIALGNHDDRANFNKVFLHPAGDRAGVKDKHVLVLEEEPIRIVVLDSLLFVNKVPGLLGKEQRAWLSQFIATKSDRPLAIFVHHTLEDNDGDLLDAHQLFDMIAPHPHVKAIFFGHSHVWSITERQNVKLINLPAVGYNFRDQDPVGWVDAKFDSLGVDLTLRAFGGNTTGDRKITRVDWT